MFSFVSFIILAFNLAACDSAVKVGEPQAGKIVDRTDAPKTENIVDSEPPSTASITGSVVEVHDGETITVQDKDARRHKIRLFGVDAPDLGEAFGKESKKALSEFISGETVVVEIKKTDQNGLIRGKVRIEGKDVNYVQLLFGSARHDPTDRNEQSPEDQKDYSEAETKARQSKRGLWALAKPAPRRN